MNSNNNMKLTGQIKPASGYTEEYKIEFTTNLTSDKIFDIQVADAAHIFFPAGSINVTPRTGSIPVKASSKSFTFNVLWTQERPKVLLSVTDHSYLLGTVDEIITISCDKCTLTTNPSEIKVGDELTIQSKLPRLSNFSKWDIIQEWNFNKSMLKENGKNSIDAQTISLPLKALKVGKVPISVTVTVINPKDRISIELYKGSLEIEIKMPYTVSMNNATDFACMGSTLSYQVNGLGKNPNVKETIQWLYNSYGKLISEQGKNPGNFEITKDKGYFTVSATIRADEQEFNMNANKNVWIGKPTIDTSVKNEHTISAGGDLTLKLTEFAHYINNITYNIESGTQDKIEIERLTANQFKIKSKHPQMIADTIVIRFIASNVCGEVSNVHTVKIEAGSGSCFEKAIDLSLPKDHYIILNKSYKLEEYAGDLQNFKMYFMFNLERKADFYYLIAKIDSNNYQGFKIYDNEKHEKYTYSPSGTDILQIEEMKTGKYYCVVDVFHNAKNDYLTLEADGVIKGSEPTRPYIVDINEDEFKFNDRRDTFSYHHNFNYTNEQGQKTTSMGDGNQIYYVLKLDQPMQLLILTAGSTVCTEIHMMQGDPFDWRVFHHDIGIGSFEEINEDNEVSQEVKDTIFLGQTYIRRNFLPGEYKLVFNGIKKTNGGTHNGVINVNISGKKIRGTSFENAYDLETHADGLSFYSSQKWHDITYYNENNNGLIYFRFAIQKSMHLDIIAQEGSFYLPANLYNAQKAEIASSTLGRTLKYMDAPKGDYYFSIALDGVETNTLKLEVKTSFRGKEPFDPYNLGSYENKLSLVDKIDTYRLGHSETFYYKDDNGTLQTAWGSNINVFYKIELKCDMALLIHTTHSNVCTELHIMQGEPYDWKVLFHDIGIDTFDGIVDNPEYPQDLRDNIYLGQTCIKIQLNSGVYKLVLNGIKKTNGGVKDGLIVLNLEGIPL